MKIAFVVPGRFWAFDLARELLKRGHEVGVFTNYPKWATERFGVPRTCVRSFLLHGILSRVTQRFHGQIGFSYPERQLHTMFGRWAVKKLKVEEWDVVVPWGGFSEEVLEAFRGSDTLRLLTWGSSHIRTQTRLLLDEERRTNHAVDHPSPWLIARAEREYQLADRIEVLSKFAYESFVAEGVLPQRLQLNFQGTGISQFLPSREVVENRCQRILSKEPLRILYVGTLSFRKGMWDLRTILQKLQGGNFRFRLIGAIAPETKILLRELNQLAEIFPHQPQHTLPTWYGWGDLFIFPTIEDGFPQVLAQAQASILPILTTTNCSGPELIQNGKNGWVFPIRTPQAFVKQLQWCEEHRRELAEMVWRIYDEFKPRDWKDMAKDFEIICQEGLREKRALHAL